MKAIVFARYGTDSARSGSAMSWTTRRRTSPGEVPEAMRHFAEDKHTGKVVIRLEGAA
jgi:hypothetical protein